MKAIIPEKKPEGTLNLSLLDLNKQIIGQQADLDVNIAKERIQSFKFKNNDSTTNTLGKIYPLRKRRDKLADTITESDITILGETIENPKIGKIPTKFEIKQELDELLKVM